MRYMFVSNRPAIARGAFADHRLHQTRATDHIGLSNLRGHNLSEDWIPSLEKLTVFG